MKDRHDKHTRDLFDGSQQGHAPLWLRPRRDILTGDAARPRVSVYTDPQDQAEAERLAKQSKDPSPARGRGAAVSNASHGQPEEPSTRTPQSGADCDGCGTPRHTTARPERSQEAHSLPQASPDRAHLLARRVMGNPSHFARPYIPFNEEAGDKMMHGVAREIFYLDDALLAARLRDTYARIEHWAQTFQPIDQTVEVLAAILWEEQERRQGLSAHQRMVEEAERLSREGRLN
jgi:hypothetical protein